MKQPIFRLCTLIVIFSTLPFLANGQSQTLYFIVEDNHVIKNSPVQTQFATDNKLNTAIVFYQDDFVTHNLKSEYRYDLLKRSVDKRIPDRNQNGHAILDWEGKKAEILFGGIKVSQKEWDAVLNEFISAIRAAKLLRPNIKWSFYGLPVRVLKENSYDEWRKKVFRLRPLFAECDFISPSLYSFIRSDKEKYKFDILEHLKVSLELSLDLGKPVLPFVWHRYQTNSSLVPIKQFQQHIDTILSYSYQGRRVSGVIWWNSEGFLKTRLTRYPSVKEEYRVNKNANRYQQKLMTAYFDSIKSYF